MSKKTRVKITEQWRDFDLQGEARKWAQRLLDAEVTFITIMRAEDD